MNLKPIWGLFQETFQEWQNDKASRLAAALSYYTIFSIAPLLIIVIAVVGAVFGEDAATGAVKQQLTSLVGQEGADVIQTAIQNASRPQAGTIASIISIVVLLFGATGLFTELQDSLNTIWEVQPKAGVKKMVRNRFLSFAMVLGIGFLLLVSLIISAVLQALINYFSHMLPGVDFIWQFLSFFLGFAITTLLFALIFKVLPDVKITWNDVAIGAIITSLLFSIGRYALGHYIGNTAFGSAYGAAGSVVVILVWVNYAAQILFFGAEFTQVYARRYGSQIVPADNAVPMTNKARANLGLKNKNTPKREKSSSSNWINRLLKPLHRAKRMRRNRKNRQL